MNELDIFIIIRVFVHHAAPEQLFHQQLSFYDHLYDPDYDHYLSEYKYILAILDIADHLAAQK